MAGGYITIELSESNVNIANNTSVVTANVVYYGNGVSWSNYNCAVSLTLAGTSYSGTSTFSTSTSRQVLMTKSKTVTHNSDGSKTVSASASFVTGISLGTLTASTSKALTKIERYPTVKQTLSSKTETSATIKWTSDSTIDYIWYSTNNGSTWTGKNVTDGKSGTYTISGLTANTNYKIKTRVRCKDSQLKTDSAALSVTTYAYPYANSMPSFTIGERLIIGLFNPLGRSVEVTIIGNDNSEKYVDTYSGTSVSGFYAGPWINYWYGSIPNSTSGTYKVKVKYGSHESTKTGGTYKVNSSVCKPSIGTCSYADIDSVVTAITGNNQHIVRTRSHVKYTATGLSANHFASVKSVKVEVNGETFTLTKSDSTYSGGGTSIDSGTDVTAKFTVTDSRGLTASKSITVTMLDWQPPTAIVSVARRNNFYSETDIKVDANYAYVDGKNAVAISYKAKKHGTSSWTISGTLQDSVSGMVTIDNTYAWDFQVTLTDRFETEEPTIYNVQVPRGMPIFFVDRLKESVGINQFPTHESSLEVGTGNLYVTDGDLEVGKGNIHVNKGNLEVGIGNLNVTDGDLNVGTGKLQVTKGDLEVGTGNLQVTEGDLYVSTRITQGAHPGSTDFNAYKKTGLYLLSNMASHKPSTPTAYMLICIFNNSGTTGTQLALSTGTSFMFKRHLSGGSWAAWRRVQFAEYTNP